MLKKICAFAVLFAMLCTSAAFADFTNRDMQLMGGVAVSNANDTFFFCPLEDGLSDRWGLFAVSTCANGPLIETTGYPARLVHADESNVYFLAYTDSERKVHALYSVSITGGDKQELLTNIATAFVEDSDSFLYVSADNPYELCRYSIKDRKATPLKAMSEKTIYDAVTYGGEVYFLTKKDSTEDGYKLNKSSGKATNLDKPEPSLHHSMLYEGYRIYSTDNAETKIYSVAIGKKKGNELTKQIALQLTSPRFGNYVYGYDGDSNTLIGMPLDGSSAVSLKLEGSTLTRLIMGGSKDEVLFYYGGGIYATQTSLGSSSKVIDFDLATASQQWSYIAPGRNSILVMGYNQDSFTYQESMMPTAVYVYDRTTGEQKFGFPSYDEDNPAPAQRDSLEGLGAPPPSTQTQTDEGGETYFVF